MKISVAAIPYFWPKKQVQNFYTMLAEAPVDVVYLGETVCSKRCELALNDWLAIADRLQKSGKHVVLASLALITARSELKALKKICELDILIEANDMAAVQLLSQQHKPFVAGSSINIYNVQTLRKLVDLGMQRWVMPVELSAKTLQTILTEAALKQLTVETEVLGYGKLPLAYSARCFTARAHNRPKDACKLACLETPEGMDVFSQEEQQLFTLNGIQTLSGIRQNLVDESEKMQNLGVSHFRVVPDTGTDETFFKQLPRQLNNIQNNSIIARSCNGYWFGEAGMVLHSG